MTKIWLLNWKKSCVYYYSKLFQEFLLTISIQILLNTVTCRLDLAFDHHFDQLLVWFVYICDYSLFVQQCSETLREHIPFKVKALRLESTLLTALENLVGWAVDSTTCTTDGGLVK